MAEHRLDPLLRPVSIALLGVSERSGSPGQVLADMVLESDYAGEVYLVNPRYSEIRGRRCYAYLESLPSRADHVVIALGNAHLEQALEATIAHGARAATDVRPPLSAYSPRSARPTRQPTFRLPERSVYRINPETGRTHHINIYRERTRLIGKHRR